MKTGKKNRKNRHNIHNVDFTFAFTLEKDTWSLCHIDNRGEHTVIHALWPGVCLFFDAPEAENDLKAMRQPLLSLATHCITENLFSYHAL